MAISLDDYYRRASGKERQYSHGNVSFRRKSVPNATKSEKEGRTVYEERDFCVVQYPGKPEDMVEVTERHKREYAEQWAAFQKGLEPPIEGFPLEQWPMMDRDTVEQLRQHGFKTVENLAQCTDEVKRKIGPLSQWCKKAKKFIESANTGANEVVRMQEMIENLEMRCKKQEDQIVLLIRRIEATEGTKILDAA